MEEVKRLIGECDFMKQSALAKYFSSNLRNSPPVVKSGTWFPFSQDPAIRPYPKPDESSLLITYLFDIHFIIILPSIHIHRSSEWCLPFRILYYELCTHAICFIPFILIELILIMCRGGTITKPHPCNQFSPLQLNDFPEQPLLKHSWSM